MLGGQKSDVWLQDANIEMGGGGGGGGKCISEDMV
jgi:hypothetical protein